MSLPDWVGGRRAKSITTGLTHVPRTRSPRKYPLIARFMGPTWGPYGANMGSIWGRQDPDGSHVGPMNFVIWVYIPIVTYVTRKVFWNTDKVFSLKRLWNCHNYIWWIIIPGFNNRLGDRFPFTRSQINLRYEIWAQATWIVLNIISVMVVIQFGTPLWFPQIRTISRPLGLGIGLPVRTSPNALRQQTPREPVLIR